MPLLSTVMTEGPGQIRIVLSGGGAAQLFGLPFQRRLSEFSAIKIDLLSTAPNKRNSRAFEVELATASHKNQVVGLFDDGDAALTQGPHLSALTGLPVLDQRFTEPPADQ